eukprot:TRINITY_DN80439_c0_g1_i1.p1 TRINITY_DN80439_c0_g1~~TRINITY_DN80439_c0_g1_i1.p1  ORF type:complete len:710 (-),score=169.67 TRINITY_DN80439_c0_g1_i1:104-2185(-)
MERGERKSISEGDDVTSFFRHEVPYENLPPKLQTRFGRKFDYLIAMEKYCLQYQRPYCPLINPVADKKRYFQNMLEWFEKKRRVYPYAHILYLTNEMRVSPFVYYVGLISSVMTQELPYDTIPNFTACDCERWTGIGRNEYIDIMNQCKSKKIRWKLHRTGVVHKLLPMKPVLRKFRIFDFFQIHRGIFVEEEMSEKQQTVLKALPAPISSLDESVVCELIEADAVIVMTMIQKEDVFSVVPSELDSFIMNRQTSVDDPFERLLYNCMHTMDERTTIVHQSAILDRQESDILAAMSVLCFLGFVKRHPKSPSIEKEKEKFDVEGSEESAESSSNAIVERLESSDARASALIEKRVGLIYDYNVTARLMAGGLGDVVKSHAIALHEAGKLTDEHLGDLCDALSGVPEPEDVPKELREFLTVSKALLFAVKSIQEDGRKVDLLGSEGLGNLGRAVRNRVLEKQYDVLFPLLSSIRPFPQEHFLGSPSIEWSTPWGLFYLMTKMQSGTPAVLLPHGTFLPRIPHVLRNGCEWIGVQPWKGEKDVHSIRMCLHVVNEVLTRSAVLLIPATDPNEEDTKTIPFSEADDATKALVHSDSALGYLSYKNESLWEVGFGIPLFDLAACETVMNGIKEKGVMHDSNTLKEFATTRQQLDENLVVFARSAGGVQPFASSGFFPSNIVTFDGLTVRTSVSIDEI